MTLGGQSNVLVGAEGAAMLAVCLGAICFMIWFLVELKVDSKRITRNRVLGWKGRVFSSHMHPGISQ